MFDLIEPHAPLPDCDCHSCALAERNRLRTEIAEADALREKMAGILSRTAIALRGPEPPLTRWSWHDLPERAAAAIAAIDVMQRAAVIAATSKPPNDQHEGCGADRRSIPLDAPVGREED